MDPNDSELFVRLLICDDDAGIVDVLRRFFSIDARVDYVGVAHSGEQALRALDEDGPFDACIVDERMGGTSGTEVLAAARQVDPNMIRILMTGHQDQSAAIRAINEAKIHRYFAKPIELTTVSNTLFQLLEERFMDVVAEQRVVEARAMAKMMSDARRDDDEAIDPLDAPWRDPLEDASEP